MSIALKPEHVAAVRAIERDGRLTAERVVAAAAKPDSPLNPLFEWDDKKAAAEYRLDQARAIIRDVQVTVRTVTTTVEVSQYVRDPNQGRAQGYLNLTATRDVETQRQVVIAECNRALGVLRRAESIAVVVGMDGGAADAINALMSWRASVETVPVAMAAD